MSMLHSLSPESIQSVRSCPAEHCKLQVLVVSTSSVFPLDQVLVLLQNPPCCDRNSWGDPEWTRLPPSCSGTLLTCVCKAESVPCRNPLAESCCRWQSWSMHWLQPKASRRHCGIKRTRTREDAAGSRYNKIIKISSDLVRCEQHSKRTLMVYIIVVSNLRSEHCWCALS
jgi:hypothetical protein